MRHFAPFARAPRYAAGVLVGTTLACEAGGPGATATPVVVEAGAPAQSAYEPEAPLEIGSAPITANDAQRDALHWVNTWRARAGVGPVQQLDVLNSAADGHATFIAENPDLYSQGLSAHEQSSERPHFDGVHFWERMSAAGYSGEPFREVIAYQATPAAAVAHWLETVYHRLPILHPASKHVGYSQIGAIGAYVNVLDIGTDASVATASPPAGVAWPPDGSADVPLAWDGLENPTPPAPPTGFPSGPVLSLQFPLGVELRVEDTRVIDETGGGLSIGHTTLTADNDPHLAGETAVVFYPHAPLQPGHTYRAVVEGTIDGALLVRSWRFTTTERVGCDLVAQNCGIGRGCYSGADTNLCTWAGGAGRGQACEYQNDCESGATCIGGECRTYCALNGGDAGACAATCTSGYTPLTSGGVGACKND